MKTKLMAALWLLLTCGNIMAQTQKTLTLDQLMWGGSEYWNFIPKTPHLAWWGDCTVQQDVDKVNLYSNAKGALLSDEVLFTLDEVQQAAGEKLAREIRTLQYVSFPYPDQTLALISTTHYRVLYDWKARRVTWQLAMPEQASHQDWNKESKALAYVHQNNLYVLTADGKTHQVSRDGSREVVYGQSVHRDEFGIHKGTFWSPKGSLLAFYRMDQSMVSDFPLIDIDHRVAQLAPEKYPMAGMTSHKVTVGVFNPATGHTVYLKAGDPTDRYFTNIAWSPDESTLYMWELPRTQNKAELVAYDAATGQRKGVLITETHPRYVEPMTPITFLPWDATKFVYESRRDGYNHLYLCSADGRQLAQLTRGCWEVTDVLGFCPEKRSIVYQSNAEKPTRRNLYSVSVPKGKITRIDNGQGSHSARLSPSGRQLIDVWSSPEVYRELVIRSTDGRRSATVVRHNDPYADYARPEVTGGTIKAADDSTDLYYRMVKPIDFDPARKYPTVVYVYGGPHAHNVEEAWNYLMRPWERYMAQRGYLIFVVDNRGSEARGMDFESCTHRRLGECEMADQVRGVEFLKTLPYVDADRIGVHGWSFGGFMTTNLMCSYPDLFKVGVAGGPVIDWKFYEVMYGERYMDTPDENPEGYERTSLLNKAKNLKGRLQIIVGLNDPTCVLQHSLAFLRACEDAGTQPDYFVYPGQGHNMMGSDMVHLHERITRYFDDYLKR